MSMMELDLAELDLIELLKWAQQIGSSDLHLTSGAKPMVRFQGQLVPVAEQVCTPELTEQMARSIMNVEQFEQLESFGEIDFSFALTGVSRYRINVFKQRGSISLAVRVLTQEIPSLEKLGLPKVMKTLIERQQGLILVTGPTGSGKSTTLASLIDYINENFSKHIITLEDPIEYLHRHKKSIVVQREVHSDTVSFAGGLRAALRQDPDVILIGEMRDLETVSTAISAAETGHLVLATLHTSDAAQTIDRIIDVFPPSQQNQIRVQLAGNLIGVLSQRLLPVLDGDYRVGAFEVLVNTTAIANLIRQEKVHQIKSMMQTGFAQGMTTLEQSLQSLIHQGKVSLEMVCQIVPGMKSLFD